METVRRPLHRLNDDDDEENDEENVEESSDLELESVLLIVSGRSDERVKGSEVLAASPRPMEPRLLGLMGGELEEDKADDEDDQSDVVDETVVDGEI